MHTGYDCYKCYCALRLHFTKWDYDYFFYQGNTTAKPSTYNKRKDVPCFEHMAYTYKKPYECLMAHLAQEPRKHISKIVADPDTYLEYLKRTEAITYRFTQDLHRLDPNLMTNFEVIPGKHPLLMRSYLANKVCLETATILMDLFNQDWKQASQGDILFEDVAIRMKKYCRFIKYNKQRMLQIALDHFRINDKYIIETAS